jgi:uncharacterized protein YjdB
MMAGRLLTQSEKPAVKKTHQTMTRQTIHITATATGTANATNNKVSGSFDGNRSIPLTREDEARGIGMQRQPG